MTNTRNQQWREGMFKKAACLREAASAEPGPARPQDFWRAERTLVREHDKRPRTLLAAFFNIPVMDTDEQPAPVLTIHRLADWMR